MYVTEVIKTTKIFVFERYANHIYNYYCYKDDYKDWRATIYKVGSMWYVKDWIRCGNRDSNGTLRKHFKTLKQAKQFVMGYNEEVEILCTK